LGQLGEEGARLRILAHFVRNVLACSAFVEVVVDDAAPIALESPSWQSFSPMLLRNAWYVAARSTDVGRSLLSRTICNVPVLFYRTEQQQVVAMEDYCPHRGVPLSLGALVGNCVRCGYHGLVFDETGRCTRIPSQPHIPKEACVKTYPIVERWGFVWIWPGDPTRADVAQVPHFPWFEDPEWVAFRLHLHVKANYLLALDNLLDLSHIAYVHAGGLGNQDYAEVPVQSEIKGDTITIERRLADQEPTPLVQSWGGFQGKIHRISHTEWTPPTNVVITTTYGDATKNISIRLVHPITPETDTSTHLWFAWMRNFQVDDAELTQKAIEQNTAVVSQDAPFLEAQQRYHGLDPSRPLMPIKADVGVLAARKIIARLASAD
jgi:vanillate O-demethylase monooxygenase subunit